MQYNLPKHAVIINDTLKEIVVASYAAWSIDYYMCSAKLQTRDIFALTTRLIAYLYQKILMKYIITIIVLDIQ